MYKLKTFKSIKKRFKVTSRGQLKRHKTSRSHLLQKKASKRKRQLRKCTFVHISDRFNLRNSLPYL